MSAGVLTPTRGHTIAVRPGIRAVDVGLRIVDDLDFDDWKVLGGWVLGMAEASSWWIGDWLAYGEWRYGEKYRSVLEETELAYDRVRDFSYVAGNVPLAIRRSDLSWSHHRVVAKLVPQEQERWLARAAAEHWTRDELKAAIAAATAPQPAVETALLEQVRISIDLNRLDRWKAAADAAHTTVQGWAIAVLDVAAEKGDL